jgi:DNA-binding transcriptional ArsR family regulator
MRIRIEVEDKGLKSTYEFESQELEGDALRERIIGYLTASGVFAEKDDVPHAQDYESSGTLMDRLQKFIKFEFPETWFTSQELRERYETVADDIKLSTVSTYLSRLNRDGLLERRGNRNNRQYRLLSEEMPVTQANTAFAPKKRSIEGRW